MDVFMGLPAQIGRTCLWRLSQEEASELFVALNRVDHLKRAYWRQKL